MVHENIEKTIPFEFNYKKYDHSILFNTVMKQDGMNVKNPQNYIPIYKSFFSLTEKNYNDINLNNQIRLRQVNTKVNNNVFICTLSKDDTDHTSSEVFFKYSPLLDPSKYLIGKYDIHDEDLFRLPSWNDTKSPKKTRDANNAAYVDSLFTYLTSQLLHMHGFIHAVDFYGSFLATKINFECNIIDDIEHLNDSDFFHKHNGSLFKVDNVFANDIFNFNTRKNKERLTYLSNSEELPNTLVDKIDVAMDNIFIENSNIQTCNTELDVIYQTQLSRKTYSNSECSSDTSDNESSTTDTLSKHGTDTDTYSDGFSTVSEEVILATIPEFPVNVIALENCRETLDAFINENSDQMSDEEWGSMIIQIIIMLLVYQKTYGLTHNDLHTNNIMYIDTDIPYIYYKAFGIYYKVPTFGRIYKIIDFGRAIYKFRGNIICSDSYHPKGDAANLYNFEPYFNDKKSRIEPNFSFDLCRLGCSLVDFFIDDKTDFPSKQIIKDWCLDDKGRNVLYKTNGEERYPDFKLYKMIARTVHNSTPESQLKKEYFKQFMVDETYICDSYTVINMDILPCYM